jgi:hypothetical protein
MHYDCAYVHGRHACESHDHDYRSRMNQVARQCCGTQMHVQLAVDYVEKYSAVRLSLHDCPLSSPNVPNCNQSF